MKIRRLPKDPGPAAWNALLNASPIPTALQENITADWLIIGAGFAGLTAAHRLATLHPNSKVVVLEAQQIASGPAGRNSGFMIDLPHDLASDDYGGGIAADQQTTQANRHAIEYAKAIAAEFDMPKEALNPCGKINGAATAKGHQHNLDYADHLTKMGEEWEIYSAAQMEAITGTSYYQSGLFTPGTVMLQPAMYIRNLAQGLAQRNVTIFENSPVIHLISGPNWVAKTPKGQVTTPKVILAVNGHANSFGKFRRQLVHVFTYASMTRALNPDEIKTLGGEAGWGLTPADPLGTTVRRISGVGGDRIIIRNRATYDPSLEVSDRRIASAGRTHDQSFSARFPMLPRVDMEYRWGGRLCLSRNNVAAFGEIETNLYSACCQNGLGTAKGTLHGILAAEIASGITSDLARSILAEEAPKTLPPEPLAWLGANAMMRWGEWKAGKEL